MKIKSLVPNIPKPPQMTSQPLEPQTAKAFRTGEYRHQIEMTDPDNTGYASGKLVVGYPPVPENVRGGDEFKFIACGLVVVMVFVTVAAILFYVGAR